MDNEYIEARKEYVERVKKELLGPGSEVSIPDEEHELISSSPSVRYSIGILFPQKQCIQEAAHCSNVVIMRKAGTITDNLKHFPIFISIFDAINRKRENAH